MYRICDGAIEKTLNTISGVHIHLIIHHKQNISVSLSYRLETYIGMSLKRVYGKFMLQIKRWQNSPYNYATTFTSTQHDNIRKFGQNIVRTTNEIDPRRSAIISK